MSAVSRIADVVGAWVPVLLCVAAAVPFVPGAWQFIQRGVPEVLFTGDGATLELRTLHAAHGAQLVGPYSRFMWSHPGPAFFYLALPIYNAFRQHGPALNLFVFIVNLAVVIALVMTARRVCSNLVAFTTATLLAVYELIALPFVQTNEWNPVFPILPLALLSFLTARLALGGTWALPAFVFIASVIVQTHVAFVPEVLTLSAIGFLAIVGRVFVVGGSPRPRHMNAWILATSGGVFVLCWMLPFYEAVTENQGNLQRLFLFFDAPHVPEHSWRVSVDHVFTQMAAMPLVLTRVFHATVSATGSMNFGLAMAQVTALIVVLFVALRRRDNGVSILAIIVLAEIIAAIAAVRAIRGDILPYLVIWISVIGFMSCATVTAGVVQALERTLGSRYAAAVVVPGAVLLLALTIGGPFPRASVFRPPDLQVEQLAHDVEKYIRAARVDHPIVKIPSPDSWPAAVAVVLHLYKHEIPIYVESDWVYVVGKPLTVEEGEHPGLLFGDVEFDRYARTRRDLSLVTSSGGVSVYLEESGYLRRHRIDSSASVPTSISGVEGDPRLVVDGIVPIEGTRWDSPQSVILASTDSSLLVAVPRDAVIGLFLSADGNDTYTIRCVGTDESLSWSLGVGSPAVGMRTRLLFSNELSRCQAIEVAPTAGDGAYSIAEIGFLRE